ncbi:MAG: sugar transferase, partial [Pseudomonadales bacterium]|nr:sugar transferase [Pseudomonadales bacterium]
IPAYNEEKWISEKIRNIAALDYPEDRLKIIIGCDGCSDNTYLLATSAAKEIECSHLDIDIINFTKNRGKVAVINELISHTDSELVALSDVSAIISIDSLLIAADRFSDKNIGVLNSHYQILHPGSDGEATYWKYQSNIKLGEASLGSTLGAHGALYLFRRALFEKLESDTINDDFILPMSIVAKGYRSDYEPKINALEMEMTDDSMENQRRLRIAAGNLQQLWRLKHLISPKYKGIAFAFFSGKALRVFMPILMIYTFFGSLVLSFSNPVMIPIFIIQLVAYITGFYGILWPSDNPNKIITSLAYLINGHLTCLLGIIHFLFGADSGPWKKTSPKSKGQVSSHSNTHILDPYITKMKRVFDILLSTICLSLTLPFFPFIAILIKLDSSGPVFFTQLRIGQALPYKTELFNMIKFRTMVADAEKNCGAQWASKNDPRITPFGIFMRKTRIDELPQFFNVLLGHMSIIGPRPERPGFYKKLENEIPFFSDRTYGVMPGITGLAQVSQGYDTSIDDVRSKVGFDHSYALAISSLYGWIRMDVTIIIRTISVMLLGRGQ